MSGERSPETARSALSNELILNAFARIDRTAFGVAVGAVLGLLILCVTIWVVLRGGETGGLDLKLLSQYYPGYTVSFAGALVGLCYGFLSGFLLGWFIALLRNASLALYLRVVQKRAELSRLNDFLDGV
jgi:hypothetical protein